MAYMTRLGLWGPGSSFRDFDAFLESMKKRWVGVGVGMRLRWLRWVGLT